MSTTTSASFTLSLVLRGARRSWLEQDKTPSLASSGLPRSKNSRRLSPSHLEIRIQERQQASSCFAASKVTAHSPSLLQSGKDTITRVAGLAEQELIPSWTPYTLP